MSGPAIREVLEAAARLRGRVYATPLLASPALSAAAGREVLLKLECRQRTGSFKVRGALNALAAMPAEARARGVVTASAGNHGLGVALAARVHGARATVFVPAGAPAAKRERIARLGAELRVVDGDYDAAHALAERHAEAAGAHYVHAFSDPSVVAGQGTVALEILEELPSAATLLVPVGGGGLIGGMGVVARALRPGLRLLGAQSVATASMHASLEAGRPVSRGAGPSICDGLAGDVDERSLALARRVVDGIVLVEEREVRAAIRRLYEDDGVVAEGSGAAGVAALLSRPAPPGPVVVVVTGGNIDGRRLAEILTETE